MEAAHRGRSFMTYSTPPQTQPMRPSSDDAGPASLFGGKPLRPYSGRYEPELVLPDPWHSLRYTNPGSWSGIRELLQYDLAYSSVPLPFSGTWSARYRTVASAFLHPLSRDPPMRLPHVDLYSLSPSGLAGTNQCLQAPFDEASSL